MFWVCDEAASQTKLRSLSSEASGSISSLRMLVSPSMAAFIDDVPVVSLRDGCQKPWCLPLRTVL